MTKADPQLLLDIGLSGSMSRDDLDRHALQPRCRHADRKLAALAGPTVMLAGPPGSGKTHLATIWRDVAGARSCDPSALTDADLDAAQSGEPLLLDGVEPGGFDENALFHIMNAVRANGGVC
jgi:chromosomal replication initiation ATPase DnaA